MSMPIEYEAAALAQTLQRVEPNIAVEDVDQLTLLNRLLVASIAGVSNATDEHWVLVRKMLLAAAASDDEAACP